eukprot:gene15796-20935_t
MPETIRTSSERIRSRPRRRRFLSAAVFANMTLPFSAAEAGAETLNRAIAIFDRQEVVTLTLFTGAACFAVLATAFLIRSRRKGGRHDPATRDDILSLQAEADRFKQLLLSDPQVLVTWAAADDKPEILGDASLVVPGNPERVLAFGTWLEAAAAQRMEHAVSALRSDGRGFVMTLTTLAGRPLEAAGRAIAGRAVLRLRDVSGIESEPVAPATRHGRLNADVETMKTLLDSLPAPVWARAWA